MLRRAPKLSISPRKPMLLAKKNDKTHVNGFQARVHGADMYISDFDSVAI